MQRSLASFNFTLESEDLSFWYKQQKWFLWTMAAAQAAENYGDEWDLTWYFLCGICHATVKQISATLHTKNAGPTLNKKTGFYGTQQ